MEGNPLGKRIKIRRKELKFTQKQLAEIAEIAPSYVSEIEKGGRNPEPRVLTLIAQALGVHRSFLETGEGEKNYTVTPKLTPDDIVLIQKIKSLDADYQTLCRLAVDFISQLQKIITQ